MRENERYNGWMRETYGGGLVRCPTKDCDSLIVRGTTRCRFCAPRRDQPGVVIPKPLTTSWRHTADVRSGKPRPAKPF